MSAAAVAPPFLSRAAGIAGAALGGPIGIGALVGSIVLPSIISAIRGEGPTEENKAKIKDIINSVAMQHSQQTGMPIGQATEMITKELGPQLDKAFTEDPGLLETLLTFGGSAVAGGYAGKKLGGAAIGAAVRKAAVTPKIRGDVAKQRALTVAGSDAVRARNAPRDTPMGRRSAGEAFDEMADEAPIDEFLLKNTAEMRNTTPPVVAAAPSMVRPGAKAAMAKMRAPRAKAPPADDLLASLNSAPAELRQAQAAASADHPVMQQLRTRGLLRSPTDEAEALAAIQKISGPDADTGFRNLIRTWESRPAPVDTGSLASMAARLRGLGA